MSKEEIDNLITIQKVDGALLTNSHGIYLCAHNYFNQLNHAYYLAWNDCRLWLFICINIRGKSRSKFIC